MIKKQKNIEDKSLVKEPEDNDKLKEKLIEESVEV